MMLPITNEEDGPFPAGAQPAGSAGFGYKVLLVDDEPSILGKISQSLQQAGYSVQTASDGVEGLRQVQRSTWDVVITDLVMPGMDGEELATEVRAISPQTPIVLITGMVSAVTDRHLFNTILGKPFRSADLLTAVESLVHRVPSSSRSR